MFREWYCTQVVDLATLFNEAQFKGNVTRHAQDVSARLRAHVAQHAIGGQVTNELVANTIRHQFTNYDEEWRALERLRGQIDRCDWMIRWNKLIEDHFNLVGRFIDTYVGDAWKAQVHQANQMWRNRKLVQIPPGCEEDDDYQQYAIARPRPQGMAGVS